MYNVQNFYLGGWTFLKWTSDQQLFIVESG